MTRLKYFLLAATLAAIILPRAAHAQAAANISLFQGSGQMICDGCPLQPFNQFEPLIVLVTDAAGNPAPNAVVTWVVTQSGGGGTVPQSQTVTGTATGSSATLCTAVGHSCNTFFENTNATLNIITSTIVASIPNGRSVTFYLTQIPPPNSQNFNISVNPMLIYPQAGQNTFTGAAGSTYPTPIQVSVVTNTGAPLANVSVRLYPAAGNPAGGPSASCVTSPGADPGAVLTDNNGNANCYVLFGPVPTPGGMNGTATAFFVLVGGVASLQNPQNGTIGNPVGFRDFITPINILVTSVTPKTLSIVSGSGQTALAGTALPSPLVVQVLDVNNNPASGQTVTWGVSPAGAAFLTPVSGTTGANGQASTNVTLASTASGTLTVTASVTGLTPVNFSITANQPLPPLSGLTIVSGNNQSAQTGAAFGAPLVVQATLQGGAPAANVPVQFTIISGIGGTLSAPSAPTQTNGQASVGVTAGATPGTLSVLASAGNFSQTFTLMVTPPPPPISSSSFLNGAGFFVTSGNNQAALSPCGVGTLVVGSPLPPAALPATANMYPAPLQQSLNITIAFNPPAGLTIPTAMAPLLNVSNATTGQQLITFQVPCEIPANNYTVTVSISGNAITVPNVTVRPGAPGVFELISSDGARRAIAVRPDGSIVSLTNPARRGEFVRLYITGAGPVLPALTTGSLPTPGVDSIPTDPNQVLVGMNGKGVGAVTVRAAPELIGVYEVTFQVPTDTSIVQSGDNVLAVGVVALGNPIQFQQPNGSKLYVQ